MLPNFSLEGRPNPTALYFGALGLSALEHDAADVSRRLAATAQCEQLTFRLIKTLTLLILAYLHRLTAKIVG